MMKVNKIYEKAYFRSWFYDSFLPGVLVWLSLLVFFIFMSISSFSWPVVWSMDAVCLLVFIQVLAWWKGKSSVESSGKFAVIQFLGSILMCSGFLAYSFYGVEWLLVLGLLLKLGIFPWYGWVPQVFGGSSWYAIFLLSGIMKFSSFMVVSVFDWSAICYYFFVFCAMVNSLIGAFGGLNQVNLMSLMGYSSLLWGSWMLIASLSNTYVFVVIFFIYCLGFGSIFFLLDSQVMPSVYSLVFSPKNYSLPLFVGLLSMAGFPPFLSFPMKFMLMCSGSKLVVGVLMLSSAISVLFYLTVGMAAWFSGTPHKTAVKDFWSSFVVVVSFWGPFLFFFFF